MICIKRYETRREGELGRVALSGIVPSFEAHGLFGQMSRVEQDMGRRLERFHVQS